MTTGVQSSGGGNSKAPLGQTKINGAKTEPSSSLTLNQRSAQSNGNTDTPVSPQHRNALAFISIAISGSTNDQFNEILLNPDKSLTAEIENLRLNEISDEQKFQIETLIKELKTKGINDLALLGKLAYLTGSNPNNAAQIMAHEVDGAFTKQFEASGKDPQFIQNYFENDLGPRIKAQASEIKKLIADNADDTTLQIAVEKFNLLAIEKNGVNTGHIMNTYNSQNYEPNAELDQIDCFDTTRFIEDYEFGDNPRSSIENYFNKLEIGNQTFNLDLNQVTVDNNLTKGIQARTTIKYDNNGNILNIEINARAELIEKAKKGDDNAQTILREEIQGHSKEKPVDPLKLSTINKPNNQEHYLTIRAQRELAMQAKAQALQAQANNQNIRTVKQNIKQALKEMQKEIATGNYQKALDIAEANGVGAIYRKQFQADYKNNSNPNRTHLQQTNFHQAKTQSSQVISHTITNQFETISIEEINQILESTINPKLATQILEQATEYGNLESFNGIAEQIKELGESGYVVLRDGTGGLTDVMKYLERKGNYSGDLENIDLVDSLQNLDPDMLFEANMDATGFALILDQQMIQRLENDPSIMQGLQQLKETGFDIILAEPNGWNQGINPYTPKTEIGSRIQDLTQEVQTYLSENPNQSEQLAIAKVLSRKTRQALQRADQAAGTSLNESYYPLTNKKNIPQGPSLRNLMDRLNSNSISTKEIENFLSEYDFDPKQKKALATMLKTSLRILDLRTMSGLTTKQYGEILSLAESQSVDSKQIYYMVPNGKGEKSYQYASNIFFSENKISSEQVISSMDQIPESHRDQSMIVIVDDNSLSGQSQLENQLRLRMDSYKGQIVIAPIISTNTTEKALIERRLDVSVREDIVRKLANDYDESQLRSLLQTHDPNLHHIPGEVYTPFQETNYYVNQIDKATKQKINAWFFAGKNGYNGVGTMLAFPFMSPNNNAQFISQSGLLNIVVLNGNGVQKSVNN